jgi:hypothetical protein
MCNRLEFPPPFTLLMAREMCLEVTCVTCQIHPKEPVHVCHAFFPFTVVSECFNYLLPNDKHIWIIVVEDSHHSFYFLLMGSCLILLCGLSCCSSQVWSGLELSGRLTCLHDWAGFLEPLHVAFPAE